MDALDRLFAVVWAAWDFNATTDDDPLYRMTAKQAELWDKLCDALSNLPKSYQMENRPKP